MCCYSGLKNTFFTIHHQMAIIYVTNLSLTWLYCFKSTPFKMKYMPDKGTWEIPEYNEPWIS